MHIKLGTTTKRINSTLRPDSTDWPQVSVSLKQDTSLESPVFLLQGSAATFAGYNYVVGDGLLYGFYHIVDIVSVANNRCEIHCVRDFLANNKDSIMATPAFIEFGFNTFDAGSATYRLKDNRLAISQTPSVHRVTADITNGHLSTVGRYVLQVVSSDKGVRTYLADETSMRTIISQLNSDLGTDIDNILANAATAGDALSELLGYDLKKSLLIESAASAIKSVIWVPVYEAIATTERVYLGNYDTGLSLPVIPDNHIITETTTISIPWQYTDWRRNSCQVFMYLPFIGTVPLQVDQLNQASDLSVTWSFEFFSGDMSVVIRAGSNGPVLYSGGGNIAAQYAIGTSNVGTRNQIGGAVQMVGGGLEAMSGIIDAGSAVTINAAGSLTGFSGAKLSQGASAAASGAYRAYQGYVQSIMPTITCPGSLSGISGLGQSLLGELFLLNYAPIEYASFSAIYGHPVMSMGTPVAGFCKTRGFSLISSDRMEDSAFVNAAMDGGVFIE